MGGLFTLSDDAHNVSQVGTHYQQILDFVKVNGFTSMVVFSNGSGDQEDQHSDWSWRSVDIGDLGKHPYFV